jgi:hypothetical protein
MVRPATLADGGGGNGRLSCGLSGIAAFLPSSLDPGTARLLEALSNEVDATGPEAACLIADAVIGAQSALVAAQVSRRRVLFPRDDRRMVRVCPECGVDLMDLEPAAELGSKPTRYECRGCALTFESDPAGGLREVDD